ncbi:hypothetical protein AAMO2058_000159900 [Amorphochlora amoebiformis]
MPRKTSKKDDKKSKAKDNPHWTDHPVYVALEPKPPAHVTASLAEIYFDVFDDMFITDGLNELALKAKAEGVAFKPPKKPLPKRPKKIFHLQYLWKHLGYEFTDIECEDQLSAADRRKEATLEFPAFLEIFVRFSKPMDDTGELLAAFRELDRDKKGYVTTEQFRYVMTTLKERIDKKNIGFIRMSEEELKKLEKKGGADKTNPTIKYEEFVKTVVSALRKKKKKKRRRKKK